MASTRDTESVRAISLEEIAEPLLDLVHDLQKGRVHMSEEGKGLGGEDPGISISRSRSHKNPLWDVNYASGSFVLVIDGEQLFTRASLGHGGG
jgi:hypothetical protein